MKVVVITHRGIYEAVYIDGKLVEGEITHDTSYDGYDHKKKYNLK
jgi:hypothetical protein